MHNPFTHTLQYRCTRQLHQTATTWGRVGCSQVKPVHHLVKIDKLRLSKERFPELQFKPDDIRSLRYAPLDTHHDRVHDHFLHSLRSDLMLIHYKHNMKTIKGAKRRIWDTKENSYNVNRPRSKPLGSSVETPDIHPVKWNNIPELKSITINCFVNEAKNNEMLSISAMAQLQQITNGKPQPIYSKSDVPNWQLRRSRAMGAKVVLTGYKMNQFLATLTEIVLPRIREYKGINFKSGDSYGNLAMGIASQDVKFFPEIDLNQDAFAKTFGFNITFHTTAQTDESAKTLLSAFLFPFNANQPKLKHDKTEKKD